MRANQRQIEKNKQEKVAQNPRSQQEIASGGGCRTKPVTEYDKTAVQKERAKYRTDNEHRI
jgi:hypothetical protein